MDRGARGRLLRSDVELSSEGRGARRDRGDAAVGAVRGPAGGLAERALAHGRQVRALPLPGRDGVAEAVEELEGALGVARDLASDVGRGVGLDDALGPRGFVANSKSSSLKRASRWGRPSAG